MKNNWLFFILVIITWSCTKGTGPDGPQGPEGPPGRDGANGSSGGDAVVMAFESPSGTTFHWVQDAERGKYYLVPVLPGDQTAAEGLQFTDTTSTADKAIILVYLRITDPDSRIPDSTWAGLPFYVASNVQAGVDIYRSRIEMYTVSGTNGLRVMISAEASILQDGNSTNPVPPGYEAVGMRVIFLPASSINEISGRVATFSPEKLSMKEVMDLKGLKEEDFLPMK